MRDALLLEHDHKRSVYSLAGLPVHLPGCQQGDNPSPAQIPSLCTPVSRFKITQQVGSLGRRIQGPEFDYLPPSRQLRLWRRHRKHVVDHAAEDSAEIHWSRGPVSVGVDLETIAVNA